MRRAFLAMTAATVATLAACSSESESLAPNLSTVVTAPDAKATWVCKNYICTIDARSSIGAEQYRFFATEARACDHGTECDTTTPYLFLESGWTTSPIWTFTLVSPYVGNVKEAVFDLWTQGPLGWSDVETCGPVWPKRSSGTCD
jgi:hypothetical protein